MTSSQAKSAPDSGVAVPARVLRGVVTLACSLSVSPVVTAQADAPGRSLDLRFSEEISGPVVELPERLRDVDTRVDEALDQSVGADLPAVPEDEDGFSISATSGLLMDDNVRRQSGDAPHDTAWILRPEIQFRKSFDKFRGTLKYNGDYASYSELNDENYINHRVEGVGEYRFSKRLASTFTAGYDVLQESRDDLTARETGGAAADQVFLRSARAKTTYGRRIATAQIEAEVGHRSARYQNNGQQGRDVDTYDVRLLGYYNFTTRFSTVLELRRAYLDYRVNSPLDGTDTRWLFGLRWDATARTSGEMKFGQQSRKFTDPSGGQDSLGVSWDVTMLWEPRTYSNVRLSTRREVQESGAGGLGTQSSSNYNAVWTHGLTERVTLTNEANFDRISAGVRRDERMTLRSSVAYKISENLEMAAEYTRTVRESSQLNSEFEDNTIFLQFKARYSGLK